MDAIAVLDFGSQYAQLIARRVREAHVYCELFPWNTSQDKVMSLKPKGFILSGGPASVYDPEAPYIPAYILESWSAYTRNLLWDASTHIYLGWCGSCLDQTRVWPCGSGDDDVPTRFYRRTSGRYGCHMVTA